MRSSTEMMLEAALPARRATAALVVALALAAGCGGASADASEPAEAPAPSLTTGGPPVQFSFDALDGKPFSTESLAGRVSVIGFVTTYDDPALAQIRFLTALARRHTPRLNVALLFLEPPENRPLVQMFLESNPFPGPVAMADDATIAGNGPFTGLHHVPGVVVLDRRGAEVWRSITLVDRDGLEHVVREAERAP